MNDGLGKYRRCFPPSGMDVCAASGCGSPPVRPVCNVVSVSGTDLGKGRAGVAAPTALPSLWSFCHVVSVSGADLVKGRAAG